MSNISIDTDGHQSTTVDSIDDPNDEFDIINTRPYPWIKIVIRIFNNINIKSDKQIKSCKNLLKALLNMYQLSSIRTYFNPNKKQRVDDFFFI